MGILINYYEVAAELLKSFLDIFPITRNGMVKSSLCRTTNLAPVKQNGTLSNVLCKLDIMTYPILSAHQTKIVFAMCF